MCVRMCVSMEVTGSNWVVIQLVSTVVFEKRVAPWVWRFLASLAGKRVPGILSLSPSTEVTGSLHLTGIHTGAGHPNFTC